jgi:hypothetical protein
MDGVRFDSLLLAITRSRSRRDALRLLTASVAAAVGLAQAHPTSAACLANGARCDPRTSPNGCCSGKCSRQRKRCRPAPGQSICTVEEDACAGSTTFCDEPGLGDCGCHITTRGFSFCGAAGVSCSVCETDADCERLPGGQRGDRCVECLLCGNSDERGCVRKCPNPA